MMPTKVARPAAIGEPGRGLRPHQVDRRTAGGAGESVDGERDTGAVRGQQLEDNRPLGGARPEIELRRRRGREVRVSWR